jgi:hypothetical protein
MFQIVLNGIYMHECPGATPNGTKFFENRIAEKTIGTRVHARGSHQGYCNRLSLGNVKVTKRAYRA